MVGTVDLSREVTTPDVRVRFWVYVLLLALKDKATDVRFRAGEGQETLTYTVDGVAYAMVPPPAELAAGLIETLRLLPWARGWRAQLARLFGRFDPLGQTAVSCRIGLYGHFTDVNLSVEVPTAPQAVALRLQPDDATAKQAKQLLQTVLAAKLPKVAVDS